MTAAAATAGATEIAGPVLDAMIASGGKEADEAIEAFWRREEGRKAAMQQFQKALEQLTASSASSASDQDDAKPLIVVVDELDRCRPDYALAVLETIKHFFSVPHVHFVLGVNLDALEHMVRARYGAGVDAGDYLKRFISLSMRLPDTLLAGDNPSAQAEYFSHAAKIMQIDVHIRREADEHIDQLARLGQLSLRDVEKILTRLALLPKLGRFESLSQAYRTLVISLSLFLALKPDFFRRAISRQLTIKAVDEFYGIPFEPKEIMDAATYRPLYQAYINHIRPLWQFTLSGGQEPAQSRDDIPHMFGTRRPAAPGDLDQILSEIERDYFSFLTLPD